MQKPNIQFPLRMNNLLHERFNNVSDKFMIPKSQLARLAISNLLNQIETNGINTISQRDRHETI
jgi:predicted DNA-binding protein